MFPYGKLNPENEWVRLAALVPWDAVEERYAAQFENNGHPAHPARVALGALIIKQRLGCSDEWVVRHISENPYLQHFIGLKEYCDDCPFGASAMVAFRKRFSQEDIAAFLEASIPKESPRDDDDDDQSNGGTLIMDATCCPADIAYPQDIELLNSAREKIEKLISQLCKENHIAMPRTYRRKARKDYLNLVKSKKRDKKKVRAAIRKQLQYLCRDIGYIAKLVQDGVKLTQKQKDSMNLLTTVYEQQHIMFETNTHSIPRRIVSLSQPFVRPIVRGKARGRPPKDKELSRQTKQEEYQNICDRNIVEGTFGIGKTAYGLGRIAAHLEVTSCCVMGVALLVMNLTRRLRSLCLRICFACFPVWSPLPKAC